MAWLRPSRPPYGWRAYVRLFVPFVVIMVGLWVAFYFVLTAR